MIRDISSYMNRLYLLEVMSFPVSICDLPKGEVAIQAVIDTDLVGSFDLCAVSLPMGSTGERLCGCGRKRYCFRECSDTFTNYV